MDILRAAIEARLYPYGDLVSSPGREVGVYQISLLERGRGEGMADAQVSAFLSANLPCGGSPVYQRSGNGLTPTGYVVLSGRWGEADVMGRSPFVWRIEVRRRQEDDTGERAWEGDELYDAFRRAFGVPWKPPAPDSRAAAVHWENDQGLLF